MTTDPFLANSCVEKKKPRIPDNYQSTDLLRNSEQTALGQRLHSETMPKSQDHGLGLRVGWPLIVMEKGGCLDPERMLSSVRDKPSARTLCPYLWLGHSGRDVWVQRKTVLRSWPYSCRMQNSGWNWDREPLGLWIAVFPLSHETNCDPSSCISMSIKGNSLTDLV